MKRKPSKKRLERSIKAALEPYRDKHPVYVLLATLEGQAKRLLAAERFPTDIDVLGAYHEPPLGPRANRKAEAAWLKSFDEVHCRFYPEDRGKVLSRRGGLLKRVLWQAERVRKAVEQGDPEGAALGGIRLMQSAERASLSLGASKSGKADRKPAGILHAIRDQVEEHGDHGATWLWRHLTEEHGDPGIDLDLSDFRGEVYCDGDNLTEYPADSFGGKPKEVGFKAFQGHYSRLYPSPKKPR